MSETTTPDPVPGWMAQLTRYMALPDGQDGVTILQEEAGHLIYDDEVEALLRQIAAEQAQLRLVVLSVWEGHHCYRDSHDRKRPWSGHNGSKEECRAVRCREFKKVLDMTSEVSS